MKCSYCIEEIPDDSEVCPLCSSQLIKPCPFCMEKIKADAMKCKHCGSELNSVQPQQPAQQPPPFQQPPAQQEIPPGISGWSWGAAILNWIWAIGNKVWIGLLALIPGVSIIMFFVLGFKGREWAWKSGQWESVEHFNRVQKKWSQWAVGLSIAGVVLGFVAAIAAPQFSSYKVKGYNSAAMSDLKNAKTTLEAYFADNQRYPETLEASKFVPSENVYIKCSILPDAYVCGAAHKEGTVLYVADSQETAIVEEVYETGSPIQLPYEPRPLASAKADDYNAASGGTHAEFTGIIDMCTGASGKAYWCMKPSDGSNPVLIVDVTAAEGSEFEPKLNEAMSTKRAITMGGTVSQTDGHIMLEEITTNTL